MKFWNVYYIERIKSNDSTPYYVIGITPIIYLYLLNIPYILRMYEIFVIIGVKYIVLHMVNLNIYLIGLWNDLYK